MDNPCALTKPCSPENSVQGYDFSRDLNSSSFDISDYINFSDGTSSERSVRAEERCVGPPDDQSDPCVSTFSLAWPGAIFDELEGRRADGQCKRNTLDGKCDCSACTKKSLDKDLRELIDFEIPDAPHVFAFHMPADGISGQSNANPVSNDLSMLQLGPASSQTGSRPLNCDFSKSKPGKRRRIRENSPESNLLALMKEILQTDGTVSLELLTKIKKSVEKEERSQTTGPTTLPSRRQEKKVAGSSYNPGRFTSIRHSIRESSSHQQETAFPSSSSKSSIPLMRTNFARNELQSCNPGTGFVSSSVNPVPFMGMGRSINERIPSDFNLITTSESQIGSSLSSLPSSTSHDVKTSNTTFVGAHTTRLSGSTLYQCTFKSCDKIFPTKFEWKRHEESFHKQRYMCKECCAGLAYPPRGYTCGLCLEGHFTDLEEVKMHTIKCDEAQKVGQSFTRKDNLRTHLRDRHDRLILSEDDFDWVFDIESDWPRECGFCGDILNDWDLRANHIELHFMAGETISTWKIPFRRSEGARHQRPGNDQDDDDDDDDDDDGYYGYDDSKGSGASKDFRRSSRGAESSNNQATSSTTTWNYRTHAQEPTQELDGIIDSGCDSEIKDNEKESTYTRNIVEAPACFHPAEVSLSPRTSTGVDFHDIYSSLEHYLAESHQHELLLLGRGRQPLNSIIGATAHRGGSGSLVEPQETISNKIFHPPPYGLHPSTQLENPALAKDLKDQLTSLVLASATNSGLTNAVFENDLRTDPINDRIGILYLENQMQPYVPGYRDRTITAVDGTTVNAQLPFPRAPTDSTASSRSRYSVNYSQSTISSLPGTLVSLATTIETSPPPPPPPWQLPTLNQQLNTTPYNYGYVLPCEFDKIGGCTLHFHPTQFEAWITHTASHFHGKLPPKAMCIFCDDNKSTFDDQKDLQLNWRKRMLHIAGHLQNFRPAESKKPDYFVLDHMRVNGLISAEDYNHAMTYTERPRCNGLVPLGYRTREMKWKTENGLREFHDLEKEDRLKRREKRNVKGKETKVKFPKPRETRNSQLGANKSKMLRVKHFGSDQALSRTIGEIRAPGTNTEAEEHQVDYQESTNDSDQEQELMIPTYKLGSEIHAIASKEDPDKSNMMPIKANLSNSEYTLARRRRRSTASSQSLTECPSKTTESTSFSGCDSPNIIVNHQVEGRHALLGNSLLSDEICFSDHLSNSILVSSPSDLREIAVSNPWSISKRRYAASSIYSSESSLDLHTWHDATSSTEQSFDTRSRNELKGRKYRVPDDARKYISSTSRGDVEVIDHRKAVYDPAEPRASDATFQEYERSWLSWSNRRSRR